jgi:hypothetical protein
MKLMHLARGAGKTKLAIKEAAKTGSYILCLTRADALRIAKMADDMKLNIRFPVTLDEMLSSKMSTGFVKDLVMDDADRILNGLFRNHKVHMITMTKEKRKK